MIVALVAGTLFGALFELRSLHSDQMPDQGGVVFEREYLRYGFYAGRGNELQVDSSGNLVITANITSSGTNSWTGTNAYTGAQTFSSTVAINGPLTVASTTVITADAGSFTVRVPIIGTSTLTLTGTGTFNGAAIFNSDMTVGSGGTITFGSPVTVTSTLDVQGETHLARLIQGGSKITLTATSTAQELTAPQACNPGFVEWDVNGTSSTLSMASTSLVVADCAPTTGDRFGFYLRNISGSGEYITVAADDTNSMTLREPSGGDVIIQNGESAYIEYLITLASGTDSTSDVYVTSMQEAD